MKEITTTDDLDGLISRTYYDTTGILAMYSNSYIKGIQVGYTVNSYGDAGILKCASYLQLVGLADAISIEFNDTTGLYEAYGSFSPG